MVVVSRKRIGPRWGVFLASVSMLVMVALLQVYRSSRADQLPSLIVREIPLGRARPDSLYALTIWVKSTSSAAARTLASPSPKLAITVSSTMGLSRNSGTF